MYVSPKALPAVGVPLGILIAIIGSTSGLGTAGKGLLRDGLQQHKLGMSDGWSRYTPLAIASTILLFVFALWAKASYSAPATVPARAPVFDEAGICRLGQVDRDCFCVLQSYYGPYEELRFDVQPCLGFSPDHFHVIEKATRTREQIPIPGQLKPLDLQPSSFRSGRPWRRAPRCRRR